ncbi:5'-deoxynucleotidase [Anaerobiospirillum sp. NML120449]|uniref:5'-deoxynucleotidase n=1 Tax=Anaerobiospirillum sp. NML120449 TaxID=2932817 RepID=UPI001FF2441A|nr:5'-deoxynucleotidase [Anaerobiospirillum sp. NML120449]MCK0526213.1 5'-deoxynucleotidase [Anaerobiospirillum sp. NML120449]
MSDSQERQSTFMAWIVRLALIKRWALMHCFREENVSEHSHQTAVIAHMLCIIKNRLYGGAIDANQAAVMALYHEVSESKLQDLNSKTKYLHPEFTREYKKIEHQAELECLNTLPAELRADFEQLVIQDNTDPELKLIVKAADSIAAYIKANDELRFNNQEFTHVREGLTPVLEKYCQTMPEVKYFMEVFVPLCWTPADKLSGLDEGRTS